MTRIVALSGTVLVVAASARTDALLREPVISDSALDFVRADGADDAIRRIEAGATPDAVVLDAGLEDPVRVAQRVHSLDRDGAVLVLSEPEGETDLRHALEVAPFLGGDVSLIVRGDPSSFVDHVAAASAHTRERREETAGKDARRATPPPLSASYIGTLLDSVPIGLVTLDADGAVVGWNRRAGDMLHVPEVEALGKPFADLFASRDEPRLAALIDRLGTGIGDEPETLKRAERVFEITGARFAIRSGDPGTLLILQDVTKRDLAERELRLQKALSDAQADTSPVGIVVLTTDGVPMRANTRFYEIWGADEQTMRADPEATRNAVQAQLENPQQFPAVIESLSSGDEDYRDEALLKDGRSIEFYATHVHDESGEVVGRIWFFTDITAHRREEERLRLLADATNLLSSTLDYATTLNSVVEIVVPRLADWCSVDMLQPGGRHETVAIMTADPEARAAALAYRDSSPDAGMGMADRAIETGDPQVLRTVTPDQIAAMANTAEHRELLELMSPRSLMIVPIKVRDRIFGAISFIRSHEAHPYGDDDVRLAVELARRAAIAIDNSLVHAELRQTAKTLQESLLPPHLPGVRGLELAARFRPAGLGMEVGGDFYDIFETGPRQWGVAVGDVCGKGAEAAALTALTRYTVRAAAMYEDEAGGVLGVLNTALLRQRGDLRFTTLAFCVFDLAAKPVTLRASSAGHPRPLLLRADGTVKAVGSAGPLLGVIPDAEFGDEVVELHDGDLLVLYTDGVTDALAPEHMLDEADLVAALADCKGLSAGETSQRLEAAALAHDPTRIPRDDIAIVVVKLG